MESLYEFNVNFRHLSESMQHEHGKLYYLAETVHYYSWFLTPFIFIGLFYFLKNKINKPLRTGWGTWVCVCYLFFSVFAKTKMPAFAFIVSSVVFIWIALGVYNLFILRFGNKKMLLLSIAIFTAALADLQPWKILESRKETNALRTAKIHNTEIYKSFPDSLCRPSTVVINCKSFENTELMFYKNVTAYH